MKKIYIVLILVFVILSLAIRGFFLYKSHKSDYSLDKYYSSIDYSCNTDSDCEIKDIHNCCGYYPGCVNKNAKTDPDFVRKACIIEGVGSICGFPSIDGCECVENKCRGTFSGNP